MGRTDGRYNWTHGAAENSEDLNLISSATVATALFADLVGMLDFVDLRYRIDSGRIYTFNAPSDYN